MGMQKLDPGIELAEATTIVFAKPCGVASIILIGGSAASTIKLYDHAATATGSVIKALSAPIATTMIYTPCKPDSFSNGCVAVVAGAGAVGYVSIDS